MHPTPKYDDDRITKTALAHLLGVTTRTISNWTAAGHLKPTRRQNGKPTIYSLTQAMAAVKKHFLQAAPSAIEAFDQQNT